VLESCLSCVFALQNGAVELRNGAAIAVLQVSSALSLANGSSEPVKSEPLDAIAARKTQHTLSRVHVVPATGTRGRHREVGRDLARREPRQILDEVQPGV